MPNISVYINALKLAWVRREMTSTHMWSKLFAVMVSKGSFLWDRNEESLKQVAHRTKSVFWKEVILAYGRFMSAFEITDEMDISCCNIWYSDLTKFKKREIRDWREKGVTTLNDLLDQNGIMMNFTQLKRIYGIRGIQLDYAGLKHSLPDQWLRADKIKQPAPTIHPAVSFILSRQKGSKYLYTVIIGDEIRGHKHRWEGSWSNRYGDDICWRDAYKNIFVATTSTPYRSLHYKIVTRIQVTNALLYRMGIVDSGQCFQCRIAPDTLEHKFWHCPRIYQFWDDVKAWLLRKRIISDGNEFTELTVLFGTSSNSLINHVIICAKEMIRRGTGLQMVHLFARLNKDKETEHYIAKINGTVDTYQKKWEVLLDDSLAETILGDG